jgi:uncharacterized protein Yka (UPF0111/DUF47 family)
LLLVIGEKPRGTTMADQHLEVLKKARMNLLNARLSRAKTIAAPGEVSQDAIRNFTEVQKAIEAIDQAIEELEDELEEAEDEDE